MNTKGDCYLIELEKELQIKIYHYRTWMKPMKYNIISCKFKLSL